MEASTREEIRKRFDKAVAYELAGEFGRAAFCYERIIQEIHDLYAKNVARRRLKWCISLEAIVEKMRLMRCPVSVSEMLGEAYKADEELSRGPPEVVVQEIESQLSQLPICHRVGGQLWVLTDDFEECVREAVATLSQSSEPLPLREFLKQHWPEYAAKNTAFPDRTGIGELAARLQQTGIEIMAQEYGVSASCMASEAQRFWKLILEQKQPIELKVCLSLLFPTLALIPQNESAVENFLSSHLDQRFVEITAGTWFLKELLTFDTDMFDDIFDANPLPHSTDGLVCLRLFPSAEDLPPPSKFFRQYVSALLKCNPNLLEVGHGYWLSCSALPALYQQAIAVLEASDQPITASEVVAKGLLKARADSEQIVVLAGLVEAKFRETPEVLALPKGRWLHDSAVTRALDRVHIWLLQEQQPCSTVSMVVQAFDLPLAKSSAARPLTEQFEERLHADLRFVFDGSASRWWAVPPGPTHNNVAYHVLWENGRPQPLSLNEIVDAVRDRFELMTFQLDLDHDPRFQQLSDGRWVLSRWVRVNDWAFEYLRTVGMPLQAETLADKVCQKRGLDRRLALFAPEDDPRFVPALHGRWACRRLLIREEIERMLGLLVVRGEQGLSLESLVQQVVGESPEVTDASERLTADERFLNLDERWFAQKAAFYQLTNDDVDRLYEALTSETPQRLPLALADLVHQTLERDWRLTSVEARLQHDERFLEVHPGFWAPRGFKPPPIERTPVISPPVRLKGEVSEEAGTATAEPESLTRRPSRQHRRESAALPSRQVTITLGHLDVRHGNLRVSPRLRTLLPEGVMTVQFTDEKKRAFIGYFDDTGSLLDLRGWLAERQLTYGDKLLIQVPPEPGIFHIRPKGERDDRVHQEAMQRQDVEKLIEAARQMNKRYHDLMIEVMEFIGAPLHREDIYQLVDYHRTASRAHIFALLSLPDCPYEELRYFVPHGNGYWSFDRQRKEAFDMKMRELETNLQEMKRDNARLQERLRRQREHLKTVEREHKGATANVVRLSDEVEALRKVSDRLHAKCSQLEDANRELRGTLSEQPRRIETLGRQNETLRTELAEVRREAEMQRGQVAALHAERETWQAEIAALKGQNEQLLGTSREQSKRVQALTSANEAMQAELSQMQEQAKQVQIVQVQLEQRVTTLQIENETLRTELESMQEQANATRMLAGAVTVAQPEIKTFQAEIRRLREKATETLREQSLHQHQMETLRQVNADQAEEIAHLKTRLGGVQRALRSPVGRVFRWFVRPWYGEDLSGLEQEGER